MCRRFDSVSRHNLIIGRVAKRLNAADCKSAPSGSGVRIPPLPLLQLRAQFKGRTKVSKTFSVGSIPTARVNRIMAGVVKWLTHQIVALACVGSIPITRLFYIIGVQPSGKARDFDSLMRWFESSYPSYYLPAWRNWQTRWTQNPVSARTCRFDPGRRYSMKDKVFRPCLFLLFVEFVTLSYLKLLVL